VHLVGYLHSCITMHGFMNITFTKHSNPHYRPGQALRFPAVWGSQISRQSEHEGGKVVSPTHQPPLTPRKYSWYSFLLEAKSTLGPWCGRKEIPTTPSGRIEPSTLRLVAQCLNQLRHRVPPWRYQQNGLWLCLNFYRSHTFPDVPILHTPLEFFHFASNFYK